LLAIRHRYGVMQKQLFSLILMNIHLLLLN
jgi:hypothetical protein